MTDGREVGQSVRVAVVLGLCACGGPSAPGPAVRLAADLSDTIAINSRRPTTLPVRALDAKGGTVAAAPIRFEWIDGAALPVSEVGAVTCTSSGDLSVRATLESLTTRVFVRCRLVEHVRVQGPMQFVLGDSSLSQPKALPIEAYSADWRPVSVFTASMMLANDRVATLRGTTVVPRTRGVSVAGVHIGDREGGTGVHIYQRVESLDALDTLLRVHPEQRLFAVPLRLESGTQLHRQRVPPGGWMLALLPEENHKTTPIRIRVDGAVCESHLLNEPGRLGCRAGPHASVVVYRPYANGGPGTATAYFLVRGLGSPNPTRFVPRVLPKPGSLACVRRFLDERGYEVQPASPDPSLILAQRREGRLGTDARREWIEARLVSEAAATTLRGRAWAVDSFPAFDDRPAAENVVVVEAAEMTVTDAREALQACSQA